MDNKEDQAVEDFLNNLEQEEPKMEVQKQESFLSKLWSKSVFPDMIEAKKERNRMRREEQKEMAKIQSEARKEAIVELKPALKQRYKQMELDRMTGKTKEEKKKKFADAFSLGGGGQKDIGAMMGVGGGSSMKNPADLMGMGGGSGGTKNPADMMGMGGLGDSQSKIDKMLGKSSSDEEEENPKKKGKKITKKKEKTPEDKIREMLG